MCFSHIQVKLTHVIQKCSTGPQIIFFVTDCTDCNNKKSRHPPVRGGGFSPETFKHDFSLLGVILERSTKLDFLGCFGLRIGCQLTIYMNI